MERVEITCSVCGKRETVQVMYLAGEDGTPIDPSRFPPSPELCGDCNEAQWRELFGPEGVARRQREIAMFEAFMATLPADMSPWEKTERYVAYRRDVVLPDDTPGGS